MKLLENGLVLTYFGVYKPAPDSMLPEYSMILDRPATALKIVEAFGSELYKGDRMLDLWAGEVHEDQWVYDKPRSSSTRFLRLPDEYQPKKIDPVEERIKELLNTFNIPQSTGREYLLDLVRLVRDEKK